MFTSNLINFSRYFKVQHRIHIDHEKSRDHGYEARFYRRHLDPTLSTRVLQNSIYVKIPAVSDDFVNEMTIEMSRLTKTQSMDALDNYELVENEKQISVGFFEKYFFKI